MPMHDWTRVDAGIYHAFHLQWIAEIAGTLNRDLLPDDYYALSEQHAAGYLPDVLTLHRSDSTADDHGGNGSPAATATLLRTRPETRITAQVEEEYYRHKRRSIVIRTAQGDRVIAVIEIVSPANKSSEKGFDKFIEKVTDLLEQRIHLLIVDPFPPGPRDPNGVHGAVWEQFLAAPFQLPPDQPLTLAA